MPTVIVHITRFVDESFPGFVECRLIDAEGKSHTFFEKVPVVSQQSLVLSPPCDGYIECHVAEAFTDTTGRALCRIDTDRPFGVESATGGTQFVVLASQVVM